MIKLVVFDIAGTTVLDKGNVAIAFMDAFKKYGLSVPEAEVNKVMGFRKIDAITSLLNAFYASHTGNRKELAENIHSAFTDNMIDYYTTTKDLQPLPHAEEIFSLLKSRNIRVALDTGFTKVITNTILKRLNWDKDKVDFVISSDEVPEGRPSPYMIHGIMQTLGIPDVSDVAKVGDTEVDVAEGRNAGCGLVISVTTGAYTREQLEQYKPDAIIDSLNELPALLQLN